jgi:hypothetical protein
LEKIAMRIMPFLASDGGPANVFIGEAPAVIESEDGQ